MLDLLDLLENKSTAEWSPQTDDTIKTEDFTDRNYVRKVAYYASAGAKQKMSVWPWDSKKAMFDSPLTYIGNEKALSVLAKAMPVLLPGNDAFFLGGRRNITLFNLDGETLSTPIPFEHDSFNHNPANDWNLMRDLNDRLDVLRKKKMGYPQSTQSLKAWMNVERGQVIKFPAMKKFDQIISDQHDKFGIRGESTLLQARIAAERQGWVAVGVNAENPDNVKVVVQGLNEKFALRAVRALWKIRKIDWHVLKVITNDGKNVYQGSLDISNYLKGG